MNTVNDQPFFTSWSGGKDSCLALHRAVEDGGTPRALLTVLREDGKRTRSHGLPVSVVEAQAASLDIPLVTFGTSWEEYEPGFISTLQDLKKQGINIGVFGDIDIDEHREWVEKVCSSAGIIPHEPLWQEERRSLLDEFLEAEFTAAVVVVNEDVLGREMLGRTLNQDLIKEFRDKGIDPSGEKGEYHTVVTDGPLFSSPVSLDIRGKVWKDGYWFLDVSC